MKIVKEIVMKKKRVGLLKAGIRVPMIHNEKVGNYVKWYNTSFSTIKKEGDVIDIKKIKVGSKISGIGKLGIQLGIVVINKSKKETVVKLGSGIVHRIPTYKNVFVRIGRIGQIKKVNKEKKIKVLRWKRSRAYQR